MKLLEWEAHIIVDGEELPEYGIEYDEKTKTAICWVPSQAAKPFSITVMPPRESTISVAASTYADGTFVGGQAYRKGALWDLVSWSHAATSATTSRPLMFASIKLTDDDDLLNSTALKELGEITIRIYRIEIISENVPFKGTAISNLTDRQIHERSKKAMTHKIKPVTFASMSCDGLGLEIKNSPRTYVSCDHKERLCNLTFKYRSIDVLRANGIAPPASTSLPMNGKRKALEGDDRDDDDDDDKEQGSDKNDQEEEEEEEEEDQAQLKALLEQINVLKAQMAKKGKKGKSKKKVKTEHRPGFIPGEVIDLTL